MEVKWTVLKKDRFIITKYIIELKKNVYDYDMIKIHFFHGAQLHLKSHLKVLCIETSTSLGSLQFEGVAG